MENGNCLKPWYSWREKCALSSHQWAVVVTLILYDYFWQEGGICSPIKTLVGGSAFPLKVRIRHWDKTDLIKYLCWENERTSESLQMIWVNYNNSLTWILRPFGDDFPQTNYDFQGSLVVSSLFHLPRMIHNLLHLVPILQRFTASTPRLRDIPSSGRAASGLLLLGVTQGLWPRNRSGKKDIQATKCYFKNLHLWPWFLIQASRLLKNLGRNPICVGCTQFKLSSSSTLIPFRGSNTPFWWHKKKAHLSAVSSKTGPGSLPVTKVPRRSTPSPCPVSLLAPVLNNVFLVKIGRGRELVYHLSSFTCC